MEGSIKKRLSGKFDLVTRSKTLTTFTYYEGYHRLSNWDSWQCGSSQSRAELLDALADILPPPTRSRKFSSLFSRPDPLILWSASFNFCLNLCFRPEEFTSCFVCEGGAPWGPRYMCSSLLALIVCFESSTCGAFVMVWVGSSIPKLGITKPSVSHSSSSIVGAFCTEGSMGHEWSWILNYQRGGRIKPDDLKSLKSQMESKNWSIGEFDSNCGWLSIGNWSDGEYGRNEYGLWRHKP